MKEQKLYDNGTIDIFDEIKEWYKQYKFYNTIIQYNWFVISNYNKTFYEYFDFFDIVIFNSIFVSKIDIMIYKNFHSKYFFFIFNSNI